MLCLPTGYNRGALLAPRDYSHPSVTRAPQPSTTSCLLQEIVPAILASLSMHTFSLPLLDYSSLDCENILKPNKNPWLHLPCSLLLTLLLFFTAKFFVYSFQFLSIHSFPPHHLVTMNNCKQIYKSWKSRTKNLRFRSQVVLKNIFKICLLILERRRDRNIDVRGKHWPTAPIGTPTRDRTHKPGMCPDRESNPQFFGVGDDTPTNQWKLK